MAYLSKDQILEIADVDTADVDVPEWGGVVRVRGLDASYVNSLFTRGFVNSSGSPDMTKLDFVDLAARSIVDEQGNRMFSRNEIKRMGEKSFGAISRIAQKSLELSGLSSKDESTDPKGSS